MNTGASSYLIRSNLAVSSLPPTALMTDIAQQPTAGLNNLAHSSSLRMISARLIYMSKPLAPFDVDPDAFHQELAHFNVARVAVSVPSACWTADLETEFEPRMAEGQYLEALRLQVAPLPPLQHGNTDNFINWFESLAAVGPGQQHTLFGWLAQSATLEQMRWFLTQEVAGEAGFDDLLAYTQVKLPVQDKLECARNYWDEMGHGRQSAMHGQMRDRIVQQLDRLVCGERCFDRYSAELRCQVATC